jgi:hypothetical protein
MLGLTLTNLASIQEDDTLGKGSSNPAGATATTINKADTCCATEKGKTFPIERKSVKVVLPSVDMVRKADSEAFANLFASLSGQNNYVTPLMINLADVEIKSNFDSQAYDRVSLPAKSALINADETVHASFVAENIGITNGVASKVQSDDVMNANFIMENQGVNMQTQSVAVAADCEINKNFEAENSYKISNPSAKSITNADQEITSKIYNDTNGKGMAKTSKKGRK